mgnify:CR=1 FL=1
MPIDHQLKSHKEDYLMRLEQETRQNKKAPIYYEGIATVIKRVEESLEKKGAKVSGADLDRIRNFLVESDRFNQLDRAEDKGTPISKIFNRIERQGCEYMAFKAVGAFLKNPNVMLLTRNNPSAFMTMQSLVGFSKKISKLLGKDAPKAQPKKGSPRTGLH